MKKSYLFLGTYTFGWQPADFDAPIALCKKYGIDGLLVKVYEKTQGLWYGGMSGFDAIHQRITAVGLEAIPYGFHYGGIDLLPEADAGLSFIYCIDAESAWDGQTKWGQSLADIWANHPGKLWISTWANPADHNWLGIISALSPHVQAWMPQVYSDKLADMAIAQWPKGLPMQPTVGIIGDGDANVGALHVKLFGDTDLSIWEYEEAVQHDSDIQAIMRAFGPRPAPAPSPLVQPPQQGGTVTTLKGFIMVPERTPITADGHPPENAGLSCVPASICAGAMFLNGVTHLGGVYTPDSFKDKVYGQGTVGGENVDPYVPYLKSLGINLSSFKGNPTQLVAESHKAIQAGNPVVFIEANPYGNPNYTHCCVFFGEQQGFLTSLDPWIAQAVTHSDATWVNTLLTGEVWTMAKITVALPDALAKAGWTLASGVLKAPAPHDTIPIPGPYCSHILTRNPSWRVDDYPLAPVQMLAPLEGSNPNIGNGTQQAFRFQYLEVKAGESHVIEVSTGQELAWTRAKLNEALGKLNALIGQVQAKPPIA